MNKHILLLAASKLEINCIDKNYPAYSINTLVTGIGSVNTCWSLMDYLSKNPLPDIIINIGIAGTYNLQTQLGECVIVKSDCFADLGIEEQTGYVRLSEAGLADADAFPFIENRLLPDNELFNSLVPDIRGVDAITVNTASGTENTINRLKKKFNPDIETMEGAAVYYTAARQGLKAIQIRAVSNIVEPRNRDAWDIDLALKNLANKLDIIFKSKIF